MRVGPATNVARINVSETITALWTFAHANGISLDDIIERTAAAGVTIDGVRLLDGAFDKRDYAGAGNSVLVSAVSGDTPARFVQQADGVHEWGDGALARDTNLYRDAPDVLKTDDSLEIAGVLGAITDIITERTAAAGVTIDGVRLKDGVLDNRDYAVAATDMIIAAVIGDADFRFLQKADGVHWWGDGTNPVDTNLYRDAPSVLKTDDSLEVAGVFGVVVDDITERTPTLGVMIDGTLLKDGGIELAADLVLSVRTPAQITGNVDDYGTGTTVIQRVSASGAFSITGFAGGVDGRMIIVTNVGASIITLLHISVASATENRMNLPGATNIILNQNDVAGLFYDGTLSRWKAVGVAV